MPNNKKITWVTVVDGKHARIFTKDENGRLYQEGDALSPIHDKKELGRHALGRSFESANSAKHMIEPHEGEKTHECHVFSDLIAKYLDKALNENKYQRLVLVAPPKTLGELRKVLSSHVKDAVVAELDKDFAHLEVDEIQKHLHNSVLF